MRSISTITLHSSLCILHSNDEGVDFLSIENINVAGIKDPEVKAVIKQLVDEIFIMNRDIQRTLNNLSSQNVKTLDFNITQVSNVDKIVNSE